MSIQEIRAAVRMRFHEIDPDTAVPDSLIDMLAEQLRRGDQIIIDAKGYLFNE